MHPLAEPVQEMALEAPRASPRILMISTTDVAGGRRDLLERMLASVGSFADERPDVPITMMLLLQNAGDHEPNWPSFALIDRVEGRLSLSAARNRMLAEARGRNLLDERTIVLFPDDDCWYPAGVLESIHSVFAARPDLDLWFCRYGSQPAPVLGDVDKVPFASDVARRASSNTITVRGGLLADGLAFDEGLGVGTPNGGGEDTEFALAAFGRARLALFRDAICIGHRDSNPTFLARYYRGALLALAANTGVRGVKREYVRKLLVGLYLTLRRDLGLPAYIGAAIASFDRLGARR